MRWIRGASTAVGFGACVAILLASCGEAKTSMTVRAVVRPERSVCEDSSGTNLERARFTITDATGGTIAEGTLGPATLDGFARVRVCSFYGETQVPSRDSYSVRVDEGQALTLSRDDLEEARWVVLIAEEML